MSEPVLGSRFDRADASPGLLLWRVTNAWQAEMRHALLAFGLTHVQFVLLASLTWLGADGVVTQALLADHARTDPMMTSQVLRALEAKGLIERRAHPTDGRARSLVVTDAGRALATRSNEAVEAADGVFFARLGMDRDDFVRQLGRLDVREGTRTPLE